MSVVVVATITPVAQHREAVRQALLATVPQVHAEPGCELYALHETAADFVMIEKWASPQALDTHSRGPALAVLNPQLADKLTSPTHVVVMAALPAGDEAKGELLP
jgi:quinol monooxygenase YgiN